MGGGNSLFVSILKSTFIVVTFGDGVGKQNWSVERCAQVAV